MTQKFYKIIFIQNLVNKFNLYCLPTMNMIISNTAY